MNIIYVWPNGDWCFADELTEYAANRSDDCRPFDVPKKWDEKEDEYAWLKKDQV